MDRNLKILLVVVGVIIAIVAIPIVGVVLWQLGIFNIDEGVENKSVGFNVLAPVDRTIILTDGTLEYVLENRAGNALTITSIDVSGDCSGDVRIDGSTTLPQTIKTGKSVVVEVTGCSDLYPGESFYVDMEITFEEKIAGSTITKMESGSIRGTVEA